MRKPKLEYYWQTIHTGEFENVKEYVCNWRLVGGNGEIMCQCTQGFRDKAAARQNADLCGHYLFNSGMSLDNPITVKSVGPGRRPK